MATFPAWCSRPINDTDAICSSGLDADGMILAHHVMAHECKSAKRTEVRGSHGRGRNAVRGWGV